LFLGDLGAFVGENIRTIQARDSMPKAHVAAAPQKPDPQSWSDDTLTAAWLGHATVLLNFHDSWILTDPALERRIGIGRGLAKLGPRRLVQPGLRVRELPSLDLILLSHAHMDHTDLGTLRLLPADTPVAVQAGNRDLADGSTRCMSWSGDKALS
jgi:L-ascorbate metabolism protein UlaG (beta-lactamase superfamily)